MIRKVLKIYRLNPIPFLLYFGTVFCVNYLVIMSALKIQNLFDIYEKQNQIVTNVYILVINLFLIYLLRGGLSILAVAFESWSGFYVEAFIKFEISKKMLSSYGAKISMKSGEVLSVIRDDVKQVSKFMLQITELSALFLYLGIILVKLFNINEMLLVLIFLIAVITVVIVRVGYRLLFGVQREAREKDTNFMAFLNEILNSIGVIKNARTETYVLKKFIEKGNKRKKINIYMSILRRMLNSFNQAAFQIGEGVVLLVTFRLIQTGGFSIGNFALFTLLIDGIATVIHATAEVFVSEPQTQVAMERIENTYEEADKENDFFVKRNKNRNNCKENTITEEYQELYNLPLEEIEVQDVTCVSDSGKIILENISFNLKKGSITVVAGKTGSGKTMLLRTLLGLYPMSVGTVFYNGKEIFNLKLFFRPPIAGYTAQNPKFFSDSILNNIFINIERYQDDTCKKIISLSSLEHDLGDMENGCHTIIGKRGMKISGGQRKRIAIARMYATDAQLYVIDDVFNSIDIETFKELIDNILKQRDKTFIIVSNDKQLLNIADYVIYMKDGKIENQGTLDDIRKANVDINLLLEA